MRAGRLWPALGVAATLTCGEGGTEPVNEAPSAVGRFPDQVVAVDSAAVVDARPYFTDPDGDTLVHAAASSSPATAAVSVSGSMVTVTGVAAGSATVTVTARDPEGLEATQVFAVTVPNRAPEAVDTIADRTVEVDSAVVVDVAAYFADPDGDPLAYSAASSDSTRAAAGLSGSVLTVTGVASGGATVTVTAADPGGLSAEQIFGVAVPNRPPVVSSPVGDREVHVADTVVVDLAGHFADPDGDSLEYGATSSDTARAAVSLSGGRAAISGVAVGSTTVTVWAKDTAGLAAEQSFGVTVPNRPPVPVGAIADREVHVGDTVVVDVADRFTDPDREALRYRASSGGGAAAVTVAGSAVTIAGTAVGDATVTVTAEDPGGLRAEQVFAVTVPNRAPVAVGAIADREVEVDSTAEVDVAAYFADPDGQELRYSAASSNADRVAAGLSGSVLTVTGVASGGATVTVTAADPGGLSAEQIFGVAVPNRPPVVSSPVGDREVHVADTVVVDLAGHFADPDGDSLEYGATSSDTARAAVSLSGGRAAISGVAVGSTTVTVWAKDTAGLAAEQSFGVTVPNRPPVPVGAIADREVHVGDTVVVDVADHFTDPDREALRYRASSGGGAAAVTVAGSAVTIAGTAVGDATVTVTAEDPGGLRAEQVFAVTVPNRAPVAVGTIADREVQVDSTAEVDVAAYFADPDGQELRYSAASSNADRVAVTISGSELAVTGVAAGRATVTVTAVDPGGLRAEQVFGVLVPNRPPVAVGAIAGREVHVGDTAAVDVAGYFADPDGDTLSYAAVSSDAVRASVSMSGSRLEVHGLAVGGTTVTVTARDPEGLAAEQSLLVTIPNRAPEAVGTMEDREVRADHAVTLSVAAHFRDPDREALRYSAVSSDPTRVSVAVSGSTLTLAGVAKGAAEVTVTARDPGGLAAEQRFRVRVPNRAPVALGFIADREVLVGDTALADVAAHFADPDGDPLRFAITSSDTSRVAVSVTGGVAAVRGVVPGSAIVSVTARDPEGLSATHRFGVEVPNRAPEPVGAIPDREVHVGDTVAVDASGYFADPDGEELSYSGVSSNRAAATVQVLNSLLTATGAAVGTLTVTVTASDAGGLSAQQSFRVTIPNRRPETVGTIADQAVSRDSAVAFDVAEYFTDPDGEALEYFAASSDTATARATLLESTLTVEGVAVGTTTVAVTARDPGGLTAEQVFELTVPNRPPVAVDTIADREVEAGGAVTVDVADKFTDPDGDSLVYGATSSDTTRVNVAVSGSVVTAGGVAGGSATVTVTASDPHGQAAAQTFEVTVPNRAPEPVGTIPGQTVLEDEVLSFDLEQYFTDPDGDPLEYSAGSSDTAAATVVTDGVFVEITGVAEGEATITVTATDPGGLEATQSLDITVVLPNRAPEPVGTIPGDTIGAGDVVSVGLEPYFTDPDGDDLEYSAVSSSEAVATVEVVGGDRLEVEGRARGEATITVTATDPGGLTASQEFGVEVPNRAPYVASEIEDVLGAVPGERYRALLAEVFVDPDGDELAYAASSSDSGAAEPEIKGDTIFVEAVDVGTAAITVTATDPGDLSASDEFEFEVIAARFDLRLGLTRNVTEAHRETIRDTRDRWVDILRRTELNDVQVPDTVRCLGMVAVGLGEVDDHFVMMDVDEVDGAGGIAAYAGYCYVRRSDGSPVVSGVVFDEADVDTLLSSGTMGDVIFHEIAHGLGFSSRYWRYKELLDDGDDPHFKGELAIDAFDDAGGEDYEDEKVPISSPDHSHWRKSVFGREGMTPSIKLGEKNPFSAITLQAMADVGYEVDVALADDYELPGSTPPPDRPGEDARVLDLSNDVANTPVTVLGADGTVIRVIPPRPGLAAPALGLREPGLDDRWRLARPGKVARPEAQARGTMWRLVRSSDP